MLFFLHPELYFELRILIDQFFDLVDQILVFSFASSKLIFQFDDLLLPRIQLILYTIEEIEPQVICALSEEGIRLGLCLHNFNLVSRLAAQILIKHLKDTLIS